MHLLIFFETLNDKCLFFPGNYLRCFFRSFTRIFAVGNFHSTQLHYLSRFFHSHLNEILCCIHKHSYQFCFCNADHSLHLISHIRYHLRTSIQQIYQQIFGLKGNFCRSKHDLSLFFSVNSANCIIYEVFERRFYEHLKKN